MITVLTCRGTSEVLGSPDNMLAHLTGPLDPAKYVVGADIPYAASVGPVNAAGDLAGPSAQQSVAEGLPLLAAAIRAAPNPVGLCGYSLGALLVSAFLEAKAQGQYQDCEVAWAAFVANPARAPGESIDPDPVGSGISGAHAPWPRGLPTFTAANTADGITSCPPDSPLRQLAAGLDGFTFASLSWTQALAEQLLDRQFPTADYSAAQLWQAGALMLGYAAEGQHTTAYLTGGYLDRLAARINAV